MLERLLGFAYRRLGPGYPRAGLVALFALLRAATTRVARSESGVRVPVLSIDETGELASSFNAMVAGLDERERLRDAFGAFVDPGVVARVLEQGTTDLGGEEVEVTVLFLDIRGFTRMAEALTAAQVVARLNAFYGLVVPLLERHGGHANRFIGDGLLGVFGAPSASPTTPTARSCARCTSSTPSSTGTAASSRSASG